MVVNCFSKSIASSWTDGELLHCARAGNKAAWEQLLHRHRQMFFRLAMSVVKDEADASDVVQVALINIYSRIETFDGRAAFTSWANRVVYNAALMHLRRTKRRRETSIAELAPFAGEDDLPAGDHLLASSLTSPHRAYFSREVGGHIRAAIDELEPKYREAIELREFGGLTMAELGEELGLTVGGAKARLHRARSFLRVALERHYPEMAA